MDKGKIVTKKKRPRISQSTVGKYNKLKLGFGSQAGESMYALACRSLTIDGMPRPHGTNFKTWVVTNFDFINRYVTKNQHKIIKASGSYKFVSGFSADSKPSDVAYAAPKPAPRVFTRKTEKPKDKSNKKTQDYFASNEFLLSYEWRKVRMEALKRHGARCQCCGASPATGAVLNVDHIKPRRLHPHLALDLDNLQVLCAECNHGKGNWDETDWRKNI